MDKFFIKKIIENVDAEYSRKNFENIVVEQSILEIQNIAREKNIVYFGELKNILNFKWLNLILVSQICIFLILFFYHEQFIKDKEITDSDLIGQLSLETL